MAWRLPAGLTNSTGARRSACAPRHSRAVCSSAEESAAGAMSPSRRLPASSGDSHSSSRSISSCVVERGIAGSNRWAKAARCAAAARARPTAAGRGRARGLRRSAPARSRLVGRRIGPARQADRAEPPAPRRRHRTGRGIEIAVVANLDRSPNRSSTSASSIAAADRIRAPDAWPATSPTASHWLRASDEAGSSRKPRPPTDCQLSPEARAGATGGRGRRGRALLQAHARSSSLADGQASPPAVAASFARRLGARRSIPRHAASEARGRDRCRRGRARSAAPQRRPRRRRSRARALRSAYGPGAAPAAARRSRGRGR